MVNGGMKYKLSKLFFFLPSVTGRSEEVNQCLNNVSIKPVDIVQSDFKQWIVSGKDSESHYLDLFGEKKPIARNCVVSVLKQARISNSNLMRNDMKIHIYYYNTICFLKFGKLLFLTVC